MSAKSNPRSFVVQSLRYHLNTGAKVFPCPACSMLVSKIALLNSELPAFCSEPLSRLNCRELILIGLSYHFSLTSIDNIIKRTKAQGISSVEIHYHSPLDDPFIYMLCNLSSLPVNLAQEADCTCNKFVFI